MGNISEIIKAKIPSSLPENWEFLLYDTLGGFKNYFNLDESTIEELRRTAQTTNTWITNNLEEIPLTKWLKLYNLWNAPSECID